MLLAAQRPRTARKRQKLHGARKCLWEDAHQTAQLVQCCTPSNTDALLLCSSVRVYSGWGSIFRAITYAWTARLLRLLDGEQPVWNHATQLIHGGNVEASFLSASPSFTSLLECSCHCHYQDASNGVTELSCGEELHIVIRMFST